MGMSYLLRDGEAHVWVVPLAGVRAADRRLVACLSPTERRRADAIADPHARSSFSFVRAALRGILAAYTDMAADVLVLRTTPRGKPILDGAAFDFSLSHTRDMALIAIARTAIGVDIERLGRSDGALRIARRVMHADTVATLAQLSGVRLDVAFTDAWTQREAHAKALGGGLFHTPDTLPFEAGRAADGSFDHVIDRVDGSIWSIARFVPSPLTRATVVVRSTAQRLQLQDAASILEL
jgi:4'-phosphopantetheinyl transferase